MPQKFFADTVQSKFIKALLYNTPLPTLPTVRDGDTIVEGCVYIYGTNIIRCISGGEIYSQQLDMLTVGEDTIVSNSLYVGSGHKTAEYEVLSSYIFGENVPLITEKYLSKYSYYDSQTHYYLGKYLRCLRDIYGLDLMPFYNCFNYTILSNFYLDSSSDFGYVMESNDSYKLIGVPIKFGKKYTIAVDCSSEVLVKSVFYGDLGMLEVKLSNGYSGYLTDCIKESNGKKTMVYNSMSFKQPIVYSTSFDNHNENATSTDLQNYENSLYLVIQLPSSNDSSIVVMEGDYRFGKTEKIFNVEKIDSISNSQLDSLLLSDLSLLQINDKQNYAFSNRLVEYLLLNVINLTETIPQNIERVQNYIGERHGVYGVWDTNLRVDLYNKYMSNRLNTKIDINGYVDMDVEKYITKGKNV